MSHLRVVHQSSPARKRPGRLLFALLQRTGTLVAPAWLLAIASSSVLAADGAWYQLDGPGLPTWAGYAAIYDPVGQRKLIFGGQIFPGATNNGVWQWAPGWTSLATAGSAPPARTNAMAIYDDLRDRMVIFGGGNGGGSAFNDTWELNLGVTPTWSPIQAQGTLPPLLQGSVAVYDAGRDRMLLSRS